MKKFLTLLIGFSTALAVYLFVSPAHAETLFSQLSDSDTVTYTNLDWEWVSADQPQSGTFNEVKLKVGFDDVGVKGRLIVDTIAGTSQTQRSSQCITTTATPTEYLFDLDGSFNLGTSTIRFYFVEYPAVCGTDVDTLNIYSLKTASSRSTTPNSVMTHISPDGSVNKTPYIIIGNSLTDLSFTSPSDTVSTNNVTLGGTCPVNGTGVLAVATDDNLTSLTESDYTIDCTNHEWSSSISVPAKSFWSGWVVDDYILDFTGSARNLECAKAKNLLVHCADNAFNTTEAFGYSLTVVYPDDDGVENHYTLKAGNWFFRFGFSLPSSVDLSDLDVYEQHACDSDFTNCVSYDAYGLNTVAKNGTFINTNEIAVTDSVTNYSIISLLGGTNRNETKAILYLTIVGDDTNGASFVDPTYDDCGKWKWLCTLFLPSSAGKETLSTTKDLLKNKIPFGYGYAAISAFQNITDNSSDLVVSAVVPIQGLTNVTMPIINTGDSSWADIGDTLKPYIRFALWLSFLGFCYYRLLGFFRSP